MSRPRVGIVGSRGMVGSVLMQRLLEEKDFDKIEAVFLSTSQAGKAGPDINGQVTTFADAFDLSVLKDIEIILTCQGSDYTQKVHSDLRNSGWRGYWIDAASHLRQADSSVLLLDPVNRNQIDASLQAGVKDLIGANCTVSIMLLGLAGLFKADLVESAIINTYQAVSGAGSKYLIEQLGQVTSLSNNLAKKLDDPSLNVLDIIAQATNHLKSSGLPNEMFGQPILSNALPWIDVATPDGRSREELKGEVETNKILATKDLIPVDGTCVRIDSLRSHAEAITLTLKQDLPIEQLEKLITEAHDWVKVIPNNPEASRASLSPVSVSGSLDIAVGRLRKLSHRPKQLNAFVVGDQLLWGAAEPLRRGLNIIIDRS